MQAEKINQEEAQAIWSTHRCDGDSCSSEHIRHRFERTDILGLENQRHIVLTFRRLNLSIGNEECVGDIVLS